MLYKAFSKAPSIDKETATANSNCNFCYLKLLKSTMQSHLLLSCLLLSLTLSWSNAAPTPSTRANGPHDVRWRLVSGMETLFKYTIKLVSCMHAFNSKTWVSSLEYSSLMYCIYICDLQQQQSCGSEPLLNVNDRLKPILSGVCRLLEVHELVTRVRNGSNLHAVLGQNILDSCDWVSSTVLRMHYIFTT